MKKKLLIALPLVLAMVAVGIYFSSRGNKHPITTPFQYPSEADMKTMSDKEQMAACSIPDEVVSQMTTDVLLEAYLDYPLINTLIFPSHTFFYGDYFEDLKTRHHFGLAELMKREDLVSSILKKYRSIKLHKEKVDWSLGFEQLETVYQKPYEDAQDMIWLEVLAGLLDFDDDEKSKVRIKEEMEWKHKQKLKYDFYKATLVNMYQRTLDNKRAQKAMPYYANPFQ